MAELSEASLESKPIFERLVSELSALVVECGGDDEDFREFESAALMIANLAVRKVLQCQLQKVSDAFGEKLLVNGEMHHIHQEGTVRYHSLCGPLEVHRFTYRKSGERNGPTQVPLELSCGLVEGATPALGYSVVLGYAQGELRGYAEAMDAAHRQLPSRSTLERLAKTLGGKAQAKAPLIETVLRKKEKLPQGAHALSLGLDRVAVPMEEAREEGAPPKTKRKVRTKPYQRQPPAPVDVNYRMAYVGTVSVVDAHGEEIVTRRYTALPDAEPDEVVDKMMKDVRNALRQDSSLEVGVVQDGAPELWNAMERGLKKAGVEQYHQTIDRYHLCERLGAALQCVEPNAQTRKKTLSTWNEDLDASDQAIERILVWLGQQLEKLEAQNDHGKFDECLEHLVYLENNQERMRYATLKQRGLPIGSGMTEGACKSVVGQRTCGSGQRWRPEGISAVLTLRAIHRSSRLSTFWEELSKDYTADIQTVA